MSLDITVNRELKSPNVWQGRHWRVKHRETVAWETEIAVEMLTENNRSSLIAILYLMNSFKPKRVCDEKRRVAVVRGVPSLRNFIRDDDNLRFSVKPLLDALKRLGLIHDDSRKWLDHETPTQEVSSDGKYFTRIHIGAVQ